jgi:phage terminase large subunit
VQVHQGGTRSGKTYSILQSLVELCYQNENSGAVITIARKTFPALRATAMRDFFSILEREDVYTPDLHNKSEANYVLFGNLVEFISVDQPQKVRGRKREILFVNEANELSLEDWRQLLLRTTGKVIIDFNPSDEYHWIYEEVIPRTDASFFRTTYKDNPYLDKATVAEIERLKDADPNYWRIYGLGERGVNQAAVFTWEVGEIAGKRIGTGLDFGFTNDPTAVIDVYQDGHTLILHETPVFDRTHQPGHIRGAGEARLSNHHRGQRRAEEYRGAVSIGPQRQASTQGAGLRSAGYRHHAPP